MRLFKLLVTLFILCLIAIFIYQNMQTWTQPVSFKLNLYFYQTDCLVHRALCGHFAFGSVRIYCRHSVSVKALFQDSPPAQARTAGEETGTRGVHPQAGPS